MKRLILYILTFVLAALYPSVADAQNVVASWSATDGTGESKSSEAGDELNAITEAPINCNLSVRAEEEDGWTANFYEWKIIHLPDSATITRHEPNIDYTFSQSGSYHIIYTVKMTKEDQELDFSNVDEPYQLTISESKLRMPNAFSPNGDGINDTYQPIEHQSLISFKAMIFNRWGKKVYEWSDASSSGWDGTINGSPAPQGVYFCNVEAKGSDGRTYHIKTDVNLLREYMETSNQ